MSNQNTRGRELFTLAIEWFSENGSKAIPRGSEDPEGIYTDFFDNKNEFSLEHNIYNIRYNLIPVLAGMYLGFNSDSLSKIAADHKVKFFDIECLSFESEDVYCISNNENKVKLTGTDIVIIAINAIIREKGFPIGLFSQRETPSRIALAFMNSNYHESYPNHHICMHSDELKAGLIFHDFDNFQYLPSRVERIDQIPNTNYVDFLVRSGMLNPVLIKKETGFFSSWEDVVSLSSKDEQSFSSKLLNFCSTTKSKHLQEIKKGLLSISADSYEDEIDPYEFARKLHTLFQSSSIPEICESIILKMNLVSYTDFENYEDHYSEHPELFKSILYDQGTFLNRLCSELIEIESSDLGYSQFTVFRRLSSMALPPQLPLSVKPEAVINHLLDGFNQYHIPNAVTKEKRDVDELSGEGIKSLVSTLMMHFDLDPTAFKDQSEHSKLLLAKAGMDIDGLELGNHSKGIMLEVSLGI